MFSLKVFVVGKGKRVAEKKTTQSAFHSFMCVILMCTFIEADFVPQYDHAFSEELVLKVLSEEGAQLRLQQLSA